jgi:hypothetical protein
MPERLFDELLDRVGLSSSEDKVFRLVDLEHSPHSLDVILGWRSHGPHRRDRQISDRLSESANKKDRDEGGEG